MTTPETQREIWASGEWIHPRDPVATAERISWTKTWPETPDEWPGLEQLLDDFCTLAQAQPDEMAAFMARYAMPEVDGCHVSDGRDNPLRFRVRSERHGHVPVGTLRSYARALSAARKVAAALVTRRPGDLSDWVEMQGVGREMWVVPEDEWDDWKLGRERFARWLTRLFRDSGVSTRADWVGIRGLALEPQAGTFLGLVAILLAREVGSEGMYECDACGSRVQRSRPPRDGEHVYCDRAECKREQQRRNQARWRARKASQDKGS